MMRLAVCFCAVIWMTGCVSKSQADAQARAAYYAGQAQAMAAKTQTENPSVWIVGNVRSPLIPWTQDLTLVKALIAAEYQGQGDPGRITILRNGQKPIILSSQQLLAGQDMPLAAGDRIEVRP